jgi:hypothetical protein
MEPYTVAPYGFTTSLDLPGVTFRSVREKPFDLYGFYDPYAPGVFRRIPKDVAEATNGGVVGLHTNTAGGRVRFRTDSSYIALHAAVKGEYVAQHFPLVGSSGFDLYVRVGTKYLFCGACVPTHPDGGAFPHPETVWRFPTREVRDVMIHFPLYSNVEDAWIGVEENAVLDHGSGYRFDRPVVYYGSSITQGGCASRPGNSYQALISRELDCDFINLGFSGSARAEAAIRDWIAGLDMSVFVCDYDHNAPNAQYLRETHEPFFRAIREAQPDLPVIFVTRPDAHWYVFGREWGESIDERRAAVYDTYRNAMKAGDPNVWFIDGDSLFDGPHRDCCTVDGCHPNDAGFFRMAQRIGAYVSAVLR